MDDPSDSPSMPVPPPRRRAIYLLPNLFTTGCLFAGFYAIVAAIDGNFERAAGAIFVAMLLDGMDGRIARLTHTESAFGKEYDSLADMVAFGLAPAIITYQWGVERIADYGKAWFRIGWLAAFFFAACAAMRLARFNVKSGTADKRVFEGLPSPSAAAVVASFIWSFSEWREPGLSGLILAFFVTAAAGALMVSKFSYPSFKTFDIRRPISLAGLVLVALVFIVLASDPPRALLVCFGTYAVAAPLTWLWRRFRRSSRNVPTVPK